MMINRVVKGVLLATLGLSVLTQTFAADAKPKKRAWQKSAPVLYPTMGSIDRLDPALDALIAPGTTLEKLAEGFDWSEGPVWDQRNDVLYFSDVPRNIVYRWKDGEGFAEWLKPSGYTGSIPRTGEPGSNGLAMDAAGNLILCQHGDRRVARLVKNGKEPVFETITEFFRYQRFNSPNDLSIMSNGDIYFTDPPYGLNGLNNSPEKELFFNGVYRAEKNGRTTLLIRDLSFPNGVAISPDEKTLYVAISDPRRPVIMAYDIIKDGTVANGREFFNTAHLMPGRKGVPDGLKVDRHGNIWTSGPGGILILSKEGKHLGTINTGEATANCAFGDDGTTLYITADMYLCRVKTLVKGHGFK